MRKLHIFTTFVQPIRAVALYDIDQSEAVLLSPCSETPPLTAAAAETQQAVK